MGRDIVRLFAAEGANVVAVARRAERLEELAAEPSRSKVLQRLQELGFGYITLDLAGYRTGSMNEALTNTR